MLRRLQPYLLLALLALPALWPFLHPGLPRTNDNLPHYYRLVELDRLLRAGVPFPRWAPDLVHGYGYPVFNFFPYLSHYLAELFHLLGLNFLDAFKAAYVTSLLCAAWFAYQLGREHFGEAAGLVAGVAYLYGPYLLYDTFVRGSLPEVVALALLPLAMRHLRRAAQGQWRSAVWAGVSIAAMLLAHNGVSLQVMPFLVLYGFVESLGHGLKKPGLVISNWRLDSLRAGSWKLEVGNWHFSFVILSFVIALFLSAFFWLPALAESQFAQIERGTLNGAMNYANNFFSLRELLALPRLPVDPGLLNPPVVHPLPLAAIIVAIVGLGLLVIGNWTLSKREVGSWTLSEREVGSSTLLPSLFFAFAALFATFLITPPARWLWDTLPLLKLTLFPWRLLGPISLWVAVLAGWALSRLKLALEVGRWKFELGSWLLGFGIFFFILAGLPYASPPFEFVPANPTLANLAGFEIPPAFIGTTTVGEYLPVWVKQLPDTSANRAKLMQGESLQRLETTSPLAHIQYIPWWSGVLHETFTVDSLQPLTYTYRTFYFPGWRAMLDGSPAPVRITYPEGLMAVDVPSGKHTLIFEFGTTLPRTVGWLLTFIGVAACVGLLVIGNWRLVIRDWKLGISTSNFQLPTSNFQFGLWLLGFGILLARPLLYEAGYTPLLRRNLAPDGLAGVTHPLNQDFVGELTLLGWEATRESFGADDSVTLNLYWKANHPLGVAYGFKVRLMDEQGLTWSEEDTPRPRDWRFTPGTDFWPDDQYLLDPYLLTPLAGTPPGDYFVEVNVFAFYNLQSIGTARLGPMHITTPSRTRQCTPTHPIEDYGELTLQSVEFNTSEAAPGSDILVSLCWRAVEAAPSMDNEHRLAHYRGLDLGYGSGTQLEYDFTQGSPYSPLQWQAGDVVRDQFVIRVPAWVETGNYDWVLRLGAAEKNVGTLHVTAPERTFTAPQVERAINANLGPVTLFGVSLPPAGARPGTVVTATLVWKGNQTPASAYHVFVHLQNSDGAIVAQSDGVAAAGARPTPGWLPGEFVSETRALQLPADLPPGEYALLAGMYLPETGERLTAAAFPDGRVALGTIEVR